MARSKAYLELPITIIFYPEKNDKFTKTIIIKNSNIDEVLENLQQNKIKDINQDTKIQNIKIG